MVSIIVPIYNREKYLKRCIDSIVAQTYSDLEIILVDDGSTDGSSQICDEYAASDSRISVIHQQNAGSSLSRIRGIENAHGEYIQFVDSDDWIDPDMVSCLLEKAQAEDADVVWCDYVSYTPERVVSKTPFVNNPSIMLNKIYKWEVPGYLWNKLYRTDLLRHLKVTEYDDMEDVYYTTQILANNPSMSIVALPFYHRDRTAPNALTSNTDFEVTCLPNYVNCYNYLESCNILKIYKSSLAKRVLKLKFLLLKQGRYKDAQSILPFANFDIRNYPISLPVSLIYWFGFNGGIIGRCLLSIYMKFWLNR